MRHALNSRGIEVSQTYGDQSRLAFVIIVDKPAGMVVHPAPGTPSGTLVNALLGRFGLLQAMQQTVGKAFFSRIWRVFDSSSAIQLEGWVTPRP